MVSDGQLGFDKRRTIHHVEQSLVMPVDIFFYLILILNTSHIVPYMPSVLKMHYSLRNQTV